MIGQQPLVAFLATRNAERARDFYQRVLDLTLVADEPHALVFDAHGTMLRIQKVEQLAPRPFTALGWRVTDIHAALRALAERGVQAKRYPHLQQDELGVWDAGTARIAWFEDPDGNLLSIAS